MQWSMFNKQYFSTYLNPRAEHWSVTVTIQECNNRSGVTERTHTSLGQTTECTRGAELKIIKN